MAAKLYVGQPIDIEIDVTIDGAMMSTAGSAVITARKPDKTETSWAATINNTTGKVSYQATALDIDQAGKWMLQPVITMSGLPAKALPGTSIEMEIHKRYT